jgi:AraC-like DNA-binding protein
MIMDYFDNIEWPSFNHIPECRATVRKYFDGYYTLDYNHRGTLDLQLDDGPIIKLNAPVAWFTFPGPFFHFGPADDAFWDHRYISFRGERIDSWLKAGLLDFDIHHPVIPIADPKRFIRQMDEIIKYLGSPVYGQARAVQMFEGLLLQLHEQRIVTPAVSPNEKKVSNLLEQINLTPETGWDFKQKAKQLGISYSHFRLTFRKLSGLPPYQYVNQQRMEKAAGLLRENQLGIKEIANLVGYEDIFHFTKLFKQHYRIPPGRFRDQACLKEDIAGI